MAAASPHEPHLAVRLDAFILPDQALRVVRAVAEIFRDQQGLRENRDRARLKYLFLKEGWTAESFLAELQSRLDFTLLPAAPEQVPDDIFRDHTGIHPQRQPGLSYVGASVLRGRLTGEQLEAAADLAERFGSGALRTTVSQNLLFIDIPNGKTAELARELGKIGLQVDGSSFWRGAIACTGTEFCKLAITETKGFTRWLVDELEERLPGFDQQLKLNVTGCPNSCGQHWIADIGIEGKKIKHEGKLTDAFYFCLGGAVGQHAAIARPVGYRCPAPLVPEAIERLLRHYLADRLPEENLRAWFSRHSNDELRAYLAGEVKSDCRRARSARRPRPARRSRLRIQDMSLLPIFLKLDGRRCLLVGAGAVALDKIASLLITGLRLRVVAPHARPEIRQLAADGKLEWVQRPFAVADLDGSFLVIAATDSPEINALVYQGSVERGILANSVDDIPHCDFYFGSVVSRGDLQIAISTAGQSPAVAQRLRREIDEQLPQDLGPWLENLGQLRREVLETLPGSNARKSLLHLLAQRQVCESEFCPSRQLALAPLEESESAEEETAEEDAAVSDDGLESPEPFLFETDLLETDLLETEDKPRLLTETVYLVGAGPGDPELLTLKALRLIQTADVILHDDLVPQAILDHASPSAEVLNVGKRCGSKTITQDKINSLMIEHARGNRSVIRLKGGDPLLFGRAAEEMAALTEAGVPFEVVPGISAAFAAAAAIGCSLTRRNCASSVIFSAGHHAQSRSLKNQPSLPELEDSMQDSTRVVYMPGRDLHCLAQEWLQQGLPPDLPCAVVSRATQPDQQIRCTTLAALGDAEPTLAPSLLIAGWAVGEITAAKQAAANQIAASDVPVTA